MRTVYVVPGFGGSALYRDPTLHLRVWNSFSALALGNVGMLRLAADGFSPGPPDGVQLYAGGPLEDYYGPAINQFAAALSPHNYVVSSYGYDWRLSSITTGKALANIIRAQVKAAEPCTLVGHSFGGLVCRMCWADLVRTGDTALVRRIVTLGTPHWGSYGIVRLWSLDSETVNQLALCSLFTAIILGPTQALVQGRIWTGPRIASLVATFPAAYETLPSLNAPDANLDPHRSILYGASWPHDRGLSPGWLAYAQSAYQPLLASAQTLPPSWVLSCVAGTGFPTANRLDNPTLLGGYRAYTSRSDGDGVVVRTSAVLPGSAQFLLGGIHGDLPLITAGLSEAVDVILDERLPPAPLPPPVRVPGVFPPQLHGPPFSGGFVADLDP